MPSLPPITLPAALAAVALVLAGGATGAALPHSYWDPDWSPDGKHIAFVDRSGAGDLYVINPDGTNLHQLTQSAYPPASNYGARQPAWSADGQRLAFGYGSAGISIINADGSTLRPLVRGNGLSFGAAWSPGGKKIAYAAGGELNGLSIYVVKPDGTGRTLVAR